MTNEELDEYWRRLPPNPDSPACAALNEALRIIAPGVKAPLGGSLLGILRKLGFDVVRQERT